MAECSFTTLQGAVIPQVATECSFTTLQGAVIPPVATECSFTTLKGALTECSFLTLPLPRVIDCDRDSAVSTDCVEAIHNGNVVSFAPKMSQQSGNRLRCDEDDGLIVALESSSSIDVTATAGVMSLNYRLAARQTVADAACSAPLYGILTTTGGFAATLAESSAFYLTPACGGLITRVSPILRTLNPTGSGVECTRTGLSLTFPSQIRYVVIFDDPSFDIVTTYDGGLTTYTIVDVDVVGSVPSPIGTTAGGTGTTPTPTAPVATPVPVPTTPQPPTGWVDASPQIPTRSWLSLGWDNPADSVDVATFLGFVNLSTPVAIGFLRMIAALTDSQWPDSQEAWTAFSSINNDALLEGGLVSTAQIAPVGIANRPQPWSSCYGGAGGAGCDYLARYPSGL